MAILKITFQMQRHLLRSLLHLFQSVVFSDYFAVSTMAVNFQHQISTRQGSQCYIGGLLRRRFLDIQTT